jgi:hypothetical protein
VDTGAVVLHRCLSRAVRVRNHAGCAHDPRWRPEHFEGHGERAAGAWELGLRSLQGQAAQQWSDERLEPRELPTLVGHRLEQPHIPDHRGAVAEHHADVLVARDAELRLETHDRRLATDARDGLSPRSGLVPIPRRRAKRVVGREAARRLLAEEVVERRERPGDTALRPLGDADARIDLVEGIDGDPRDLEDVADAIGQRR